MLLSISPLNKFSSLRNNSLFVHLELDTPEANIVQFIFEQFPFLNDFAIIPFPITLSICAEKKSQNLKI